jgi:hypothetical protein
VRTSWGSGSLRQTIAWRFDLITADQQRFFRLLGVFGGSCVVVAVAAVTETAADPNSASLPVPALWMR